MTYGVENGDFRCYDPKLLKTMTIKLKNEVSYYSYGKHLQCMVLDNEAIRPGVVIRIDTRVPPHIQHLLKNLAYKLMECPELLSYKDMFWCNTGWVEVTLVGGADFIESMLPIQQEISKRLTLKVDKAMETYLQ